MKIEDLLNMTKTDLIEFARKGLNITVHNSDTKFRIVDKIIESLKGGKQCIGRNLLC